MIQWDKQQQTITLTTRESSYQMKVDHLGVLLHTYYGPRLRGGDLSYRICPEDRGFSPNPYDAGKDRTYSLDTQPQEYSSSGLGDFRLPCLEADLADGSHAVDLRYVRHSIADGKYALEGLPAFYGDGITAQTLTVELRDAASGLTVELLYGVLEEYDMITRSVVVKNGGNQPLTLTRVASACLDFPAGEHDLLTLGGAYAREREPVRAALTQGIHTAGSVRGASSHQQNPFLALLNRDTTEDTGFCWAMALVYSGNFQASAELTQFHETRLTLGIHPFHFAWTLQPGEAFTAPEAAMVFSARGLGHMSRLFHRAIRRNLCRGPWKEKRRPILINNWEATLFDFTAEKIRSIAQTASQVGIELMVMDDGWFGQRNDDFRGLGDWNVNEEKLPGGLRPLAESIQAMGMKFGLWVEPEMVNEDSDLYRAHPDWALQIPGRPATRGRYQLVLDLTRPEAREYVWKNLRATLRSAPISYVKWDMNRSLTDVWSHSLPAARQGEVYHRYVLGVYEILENLHREFPHLLLEGCSGGGGRFDCGMLYYAPQIWLSDNTDAIDRLKIQYGTSLVYPCAAMGAHVSAVPNGLTHRSVPLHTRAVVAAAGTFGYELDLNELTAVEREEVAQQVAHFRTVWDLVMKGDYYRLTDAFSDTFTAWMHVSEDRSRALVSAVLTERQANPVRALLRLKGLDPHRDYLMNGKVYGGDQLMYAGVPLPFWDEYQAVQYELTAVAP